MDIHEKHETDLTRAERRQLEKEKLQSMDWKHKIGYIWDYYKPQIFGVIAIFAAIWFGFSWYENSKYETIMYAAVTDGYMNEDESEQMNREYKEFIGDQEKYHRVSIDTTVAIGSEDSQARYNATMKLNTIVAAGAVDVVIGSEEHVKDFVTQGVAENLSGVLSEEMQETYQDHIVDDKLFDLTGSAKIGNPLHVTAEPVYLVILNIGERQEYAAKFLEYLMQ